MEGHLTARHDHDIVGDAQTRLSVANFFAAAADYLPAIALAFGDSGAADPVSRSAGIRPAVRQVSTR